MTQIHVTQGDIDAGVRKDCSYCPIARAIIKICNDSVAIDVRPNHAIIGKACNIFGDVAPLPDDAREFISQFDKGKPVKPFSFELNLPEWALPTP